MRIGIACDGEPPPAELLDLLEAAGLPAASLRGQRPPALLPAGGGVWLLATGSDVLRACDRGGLDSRRRRQGPAARRPPRARPTCWTCAAAATNSSTP